MLNVGRAEGFRVTRPRLEGRVTGFRFWIVSRERKNKKPLEKRSPVPKVDIDRKKKSSQASPERSASCRDLTEVDVPAL